MGAGWTELGRLAANHSFSKPWGRNQDQNLSHLTQTGWWYLSGKTNLIMSYPNLNFSYSHSPKSNILTKGLCHFLHLTYTLPYLTTLPTLERLYSSSSRLAPALFWQCACVSLHCSWMACTACCPLLSPASCKPWQPQWSLCDYASLQKMPSHLCYIAACYDMVCCDNNGLFSFCLELCKFKDHTCNLYLYL